MTAEQTAGMWLMLAAIEAALAVRFRGPYFAAFAVIAFGIFLAYLRSIPT